MVRVLMLLLVGVVVAVYCNPVHRRKQRHYRSRNTEAVKDELMATYEKTLELVGQSLDQTTNKRKLRTLKDEVKNTMQHMQDLKRSLKQRNMAAAHNGQMKKEVFMDESEVPRHGKRLLKDNLMALYGRTLSLVGQSLDQGNNEQKKRELHFEVAKTIGQMKEIKRRLAN